MVHVGASAPLAGDDDPVGEDVDRGALQVDGVSLPSGSGSKAEVIQGFHNITMQGTDFYSQNTQVADGVTDPASGTVITPTEFRPTATERALQISKPKHAPRTATQTNQF